MNTIFLKEGFLIHGYLRKSFTAGRGGIVSMSASDHGVFVELDDESRLLVPWNNITFVMYP